MTTDGEIKEYTVEDVSNHTDRDDCWLVIGNKSNGKIPRLHFQSIFNVINYIAGGAKVYDVSNYLDDHPGGAEVLLDLGGQYADPFFEDIGHSEDARKELKTLIVGKLKEGEINKYVDEAATSNSNDSVTSNLVILLVLISAVFLGYYRIFQ